MPDASGHRICIVVAVAENAVIGRAGKLPWRLRSDLARFRELTLGKPVIMGRKTMDSLGKPLSGRPNIVVTRRTDFAMPGVVTARSLDDAIAIADDLAARSGASELMIIGGAEIYAAAMPRVDRIYLTRVHGRPEGDTFLPSLDAGAWRAVSQEFHAAGPGDDFDWTLEILDRR